MVLAVTGTLTLSSMVALFGAMVVLAAIPSLSVLVVSTRSATLGLGHGVFTTLGIVTGDVIFIAMALGSLSLLARLLGEGAILIRYLGGVYLLFLGVTLIRARPQGTKMIQTSGTSWLSSFGVGLALTLADQKATLFYLGFLPAFLDIATVSWLEGGMIILTAIAAVGGVKLIYALLAAKLGTHIHGFLPQDIIAIARGWSKTIAGLVLILVSFWLLLP